MSRRHDQSLPYDDTTDANARLAYILHGLGRCLALSEITPGTSFYLRRINDFLQVHKVNRVPLDLAVELVPLLYQVVIDTEESHDVGAAATAASVLCSFLRKRSILHTGAFYLDWRPLYSFIREYHLAKNRDGSTLPPSFIPLILNLTAAARRFFRPAATQEMLDELLPMLCPHDTSFFFAAACLCTFLPTGTEQPHHLWLSTMYTTWNEIQNVSGWDQLFTGLFRRLAFASVADDQLVDWQPLLPDLYSRFLGVLRLPVGSNGGLPHSTHLPPTCDVFVKRDRNAFRPIRDMANFMVTTLRPGDCAQPDAPLRRMFQSIESFYHPSNMGQWQSKLAALIHCLAVAFAKRLCNEKRATRGDTVPYPVAPLDQRLTHDDGVAFVHILQPATLLSLFGKSQVLVMSALSALKVLVDIDPSSLLPLVLDRVYPALETLTDTNTTGSAIAALTMLMRPLTAAPSPHLLPLLHLILPGIDANDPSKTTTTLRLLHTLVQCIPIADCSAAASQQPTEAARETCRSTAHFDDWLALLLQRIFTLIEFQPSENRSRPLGALTDAHGAGAGSGSVGVRFNAAGKRIAVWSVESNVARRLTVFFEQLFMQLSPTLYTEALRHVHQKFFSSLRVNSLKLCGQLCAAVARARPAQAMALMLPPHLDAVVNLLANHEGVAADGLPDNDLVWPLRMIGQCIKNAGDAVLEYVPRITEVVALCVRYEPKSRALVKLAGKIVRNLLRALLNIYPLESRTVPDNQVDDIWSDPARLFASWSSPGDRDNLHIRWHVPSVADVAAAESLLHTFLEPALTSLAHYHTTTSSDNSPRDTSSDAAADVVGMSHQLLIMFNCIRGVAASLPHTAPGVDAVLSPTSSVDSLVPPRFVTVPDAENPVFASAYLLGVKARMHEALIDFTDWLLRHHEDETRTMRLAVKTLQNLITYNGVRVSDSTLASAYQSDKATLRVTTDPDKNLPRPVLVIRTYAQHNMRLGKNLITGSYTPLMHRTVALLIGLSTSNYARVRSRAQKTLQKVNSINSESRQVTVTSTLNVLDRVIDKINQPTSAVKLADDGIAAVGGSDTTAMEMDTLQDSAAPEQAQSLVAIDEETHNTVKGALFVLRDILPLYYIGVMWASCDGVLPRLIALQRIDKLSVQDLVQKVSSVISNVTYVPIRADISEAVMQRGATFCATVSAWLAANPCAYPPPIGALSDTPEQVQERVRSLVAANDATYTRAVDSTLAFLRSEKLHWRYEMICFAHIIQLIRNDHSIHPSIARLGLNAFYDDSRPMRQLALSTVSTLLLLQKTRSPKLPSGTVTIDTMTARLDDTTGERRLWNVADAVPAPQSEDEWNTALFFDKNYAGWKHRVLPRAVAYSYANMADGDLPGGFSSKDSRNYDEIREVLREAWTSQAYVERVLAYMDQEKDASQDDADTDIVQMFKGVFASFGEAAFDAFRPSIVRLCAPRTDRWSQRLASEVVSGLVRGSKHWPFGAQQRLWTFLTPLLQNAFESASNETLASWSTLVRNCVYDRDPKRLTWLIRFLVHQPLDWQLPSFTICTRLNFIQTILGELSWRGLEPSLHTLNEMLAALDHPYKLVRESVGVTIFTVFRSLWDPDQPEGLAPLHAFVDAVVAQWATLLEQDLERLRQPTTATTTTAAAAAATTTTTADGGDDSMDTRADDDDNDSSDAPATAPNAVVLGTSVDQPSVRVAKTVLNWLINSFHGGAGLTCLPYISKILPLFFRMYEFARDEDLQALLRYTLSLISHMRLPVTYLDYFVGVIETVVAGDAWRTKVAILHFLQGFVFRNLFRLTRAHLDTLVAVLYQALLDPQLEVQQLAAATFSGLVRCGALPVCDYHIEERFRQLAATPLFKLPRRRRTQQQSQNATLAAVPPPLSEEKQAQMVTAKRTRLAGVLGMACLVQAYPYSVPEWMPQMLVDLGDYLSDPEPIRSTAKKAHAEFWRTHQDEWHYKHKLLFTDDQLGVITDLLISPSYYV